MNLMKLVWALIGAIVFGLQTGLTNGGFSLIEQIGLGSVVLGVVATWLIPNTSVLATAKTWVNALSTGVALLATLVGDGLTGQDWLSVLILVLTTAGVYIAPGPEVVPVRRGTLDNAEY